MLCRRQVREDRRIFYRDQFLIVITIRDPRLHLGAVERSGDEPFVEGMFVVVSLAADGIKPGHQAGALGYDVRLELWIANWRREVCRNLGAEWTLLEIGTFVSRARLLHAASLESSAASIHHERVFA